MVCWGVCMTTHFNSHGQPIGYPVGDWQNCLAPTRDSYIGQYGQIEPLQVGQHGHDLFSAFVDATDNADWTYLPYGPFTQEKEFLAWLSTRAESDDPLFYAIIDKATGKAVGMASYLRIDPANGVIEVGHIHFSRRLQKTPIATEAMYLMMKQAFDLGYRRYEWKCDAHNAPSCKAAKRLGLIYEGTFRQAVMYKNRNRDTAWFAVIDRDWPLLQGRFEQWLKTSNFDAKGRQRRRLQDC